MYSLLGRNTGVSRTGLRATAAHALAEAMEASALAEAMEASAGATRCTSGLARVLSSQTVAETRWLRLSTLSYLDQTGRERKWEMASRTTRLAHADADAVAIVALLRHAGEIDTLLVEQFRAPMNGITLELPAGLIDHGETAAEAAVRGELLRLPFEVECIPAWRNTRQYTRLTITLRDRTELREETGYVGTVSSISPPIALSPGLTNESVRLCVVDVDLDAPENQSPKQCPDDGEFIHTHRVPLNKLEEVLAAKASQGHVPFCGLQMFVAGLTLGMQMRDRRGS